MLLRVLPEEGVALAAELEAEEALELPLAWLLLLEGAVKSEEEDAESESESESKGVSEDEGVCDGEGDGEGVGDGVGVGEEEGE